MQQLEAIRMLAQSARQSDALVVSEIGSQTCWLYESGDHPSYLYLSGPMGMAPSVALGVAMAHPGRKVLAICGDGSLAMNMSALVTISHVAPSNLTLAVMDNGVYDFTGQIPSPSASVDWSKITAGLKGFKQAQAMPEKPFSLSNEGPFFLYCRVEPSVSKPKSFPFAAPEVHKRFKDWCGSL